MMASKNSHHIKLFYSSVLGRFTTEPGEFVVPVDDHIVHRGDGVFEAIRFHNQKAYLLTEHLNRLERSAESIRIRLSFPFSVVLGLILQGLQETKLSHGMIRIFLSRGPGSFSVHPKDSIGAQLYIAFTEFKPLSESLYQNGVKVALTHGPSKSDWMARVKSCNYLINAMMKLEAEELGVDFILSKDPMGFITEGPTENFLILDENNHLAHPKWDHMLQGTTLRRLMRLAQENGLKISEPRDIRDEDVFRAKEAFMIGTTIEVLPVVQFQGKPIGDGKVGDFAKKLRHLIQKDL